MKLDIHLLDPADQARKCEKLLAGVVALAVRDLATPPVKTAGRAEPSKRGHPSEVMRLHGISSHAFSAARFLFAKSGGLDAYMHWLDMNPVAFRKKLLTIMWDDSPGLVGGWEPIQRRAMKANYLRWMDLQWIEPTEEDDND